MNEHDDMNQENLTVAEVCDTYHAHIDSVNSMYQFIEMLTDDIAATIGEWQLTQMKEFANLVSSYELTHPEQHQRMTDAFYFGEIIGFAINNATQSNWKHIA